MCSGTLCFLMSEGQKTACGIGSILPLCGWDPGIECRSSGMVASAFAIWAIFQLQKFLRKEVFLRKAPEGIMLVYQLNYQTPGLLTYLLTWKYVTSWLWKRFKQEYFQENFSFIITGTIVWNYLCVGGRGQLCGLRSFTFIWVPEINSGYLACVETTLTSQRVNNQEFLILSQEKHLPYYVLQGINPIYMIYLIFKNVLWL